MRLFIAHNSRHSHSENKRTARQIRLKRQQVGKYKYRIYSFCSPGLYFFQPNVLPGPYSSTGACYFQSKIMHKNYR